MEEGLSKHAESRSLKQRLLDSVLQLHHWRIHFNGEDVGYGYDPYEPKEKYHYPEAYSVFGQGYLSLYETTGNREYLVLAEGCADWLIRNASPRYENLSWGLPWGWRTWDAPADLSYLITTALAGNFFMRLFETTQKKEYLDTCFSIANWIVEENGFMEAEEGVLFYYANHPPLKFPVLNPSVVASCFLSRLTAVTKAREFAGVSLGALEHAMSKQNADGSWYYSEQRRYPDNFHTAIILEALTECSWLFPESEQLRKSVERGVRFYRKRLFSERGMGMEAVVPRRKRWKPRVLFRRYLGGGRVHPPARLWCYGAAMRTFAKQVSNEHSHRFCIKIAQYIMAHLQLATGAFRYQEEDERIFIRHEAHIFDGIATMLNHWAVRGNAVFSQDEDV